MNDDRNSPKPLPDDFGMTMQNIPRPKKQAQSDDFDMTTPNVRVPQQSQPNRQQPPPLPQDDFGMTMQNIPRPQKNQSNYNSPPPASEDYGMTMPNVPKPGSNQQASNPPYNNPPSYGNQSPYNQSQDDYGMTTPNLRLPNNYNPPPPRQSVDDFDLTMQNQRSAPSDLNFDSTAPGGNRNYGSSGSEPDFGSTQMYINLPAQKTRTFEPAPTVAPATEQKKAKKGLPLWAWVVMGGSAAFMFVVIAGVAAYLWIYSNMGFTLIVKGAPPNSDVFLDGSRVGVTSADGSIKILGLEARKRNLKVSHTGFTDFNDTIVGENGSVKEVIAQVKPLPVTETQLKPCEACKDQDPRICKAECDAADALDRLTPPFTVDDLVRAMNLQIINFETNKYDIPPAREVFLRKAAEKFKQLSGKPIVEIGGHTDNVGGDAPNLELSQNRAIAVRTMLVAFGVDSSMLTMKGYGKSQPKTDNNTEEGRFQNRRIEYKVISR